jgi:hypothetical protein
MLKPLRSFDARCIVSKLDLLLDVMTGDSADSFIFPVSTLFDCFGSVASDQLEQVADFSVGFDRMAKRLSFEDVITVLPSHSFPFNEAAFLQVLNDPLNSSLGDAYFDGNLAKHFFRVGVQHSQHMRVIGEKGPAGRSLRVVTAGGLSFSFPRCGLICLHTGISFGKS